MVVEIHLRLRGDEDLEFRVLRDVAGEDLIERVDAFDDERFMLADGKGSARNRVTELEVETRKGDGLAVD